MTVQKRKQNPIQLPSTALSAARAIGVTPAYMSQILNGKRMPSLPMAAVIAAYMGMRIDTLYKRLQTVQARAQADSSTAQKAA